MNLNKPGKLTQDEYEIFKRHPGYGKDILEPIRFLHPLIPGVHLHHERWDGRAGYPLGLKGNDVPLIARIIAVADTYDAMTSDRAYRRALPHDVAVGEIDRCSGSQFDPQVSRAFNDGLDVFREEESSKGHRSPTSWVKLGEERLPTSSASTLRAEEIDRGHDRAIPCPVALHNGQPFVTRADASASRSNPRYTPTLAPMLDDKLRECLTFDDVLLAPAFSEVLPKDVDVRTRLCRGLDLNIPILSAAMDSVTESRTAITMAREGGIGILHKNLPIEAQAREVERVKRAESGMILGPVTARPSQSLRAALEVMREHDISGVPIVEGERPVGILTARDIRFEQNLDQPVSVLMTKELVTVTPGVTVDEAKRLLHKHRIEKLLVVDASGKLVGLITIKDILQADKYPQASKDEQRRLRIGAAIGPGPDRHERTAALVAAGVDVIVVDTAHGHSKGVIDAVRATKRDFPGVRVIAGNVATSEGAEALADAGADGVKVGIGSGKHLHDPRRRWGWRAADYGRERLRPGGRASATTCPSSPTEA